MAEGSVDDIFVEIEVRLERLQIGLRNAEQEIGSSTRRMNRVTQGVGEGFGSISPNVQKALITLGAMHISLRTVESLADVVSAGFGLWTADIEDSRVAAEEFLHAIEKIPEIGTAFAAGRGLGEFFIGFREFFEQEVDPIVADIDRFLANLDKGSARFTETQRRVALATQIATVTERQGKAAERELRIIDAATEAERVRLKFMFEREDLARSIFELERKAGRLDPRRGEVFRGKIDEFEQQILDLIDAREREALRKRRRVKDPTESFVTAAGTATFGIGGFNPQAALDPPTKQGQEQQRQEAKQTNQRLGQLIEAVQEVGFQ